MLTEIENGKLFLPAIQRKFVWNEEQITKLFDSLMRGYPIGTFLFGILIKKRIISKIMFFMILLEITMKEILIKIL